MVTAIVLIAVGLRPWNDQSTFLFAGCLLARRRRRHRHFFRVSARRQRHPQAHRQNIFASMVQLTRRNTRRYGGYLVHFGVVVIFIGIAGGAFKQSHEQEMNNGQSMTIGPYRIVCQSFTQDSNPNYDTEFALLDVYRGNKKITQLAPEKRFYAASQQPSTMVANHSTLAWDLYVIYAGKNPDSGLPIIKVFLNPLMAWIWIGVVMVAVGTLVALAPNLSAALASGRTRTGVAEGSKPPVAKPQLADEPEVAVAGRSRRLISRSILVRGSQLALLGIVIAVTAGATDSSARFDKDSHEMMCMCSCNQLLGECNHVGCPVSPVMLARTVGEHCQGR